MNKLLTTILVITLASVLTLGLVVSGCPGEPEQNSEQNGVALGEITGVSTDSAQIPQLGKLAPDFQFQTPEGQSTSLSDLKGKPVLINFWQIRCDPCRREMPYLQQVYDQWQGKGLVLLAINIGESPSRIMEFMQSQGLSLPVLLDSEGKIAERYGIRAIPVTFFIDKYGIIQEIRFGAFQSQAEIESSLSKLTMTK